MNKVVVAYCGVHQAYQLALAAQEMGVLDRFFCSLWSQGPWGQRVARLVGPDRLRAYDCPELDPGKVHEHPCPLLLRKIATRYSWGTEASRLFRTHDRFDRWAASTLPSQEGDLVVGSETCCQRTFREAKRRSARTLLDRPGIDESHLAAATHEAASLLGIDPGGFAEEPACLQDKKAEELELADRITLCSDYQLQIMRRSQAGLATKCSVIPLWVDSAFWSPGGPPLNTRGPLKVLYAGSISLRKGVPFLCRAIEQLGDAVSLTLVGSLQENMRPFIGTGMNLQAAVSKPTLRNLYRSHDVLVLPSLGDSFGFVAMEAMACGLPVVVTSSCGVPLPDESWRIPPMDSDAIARRLALYLNDRGRCAQDGQIAQQFAGELTLTAYRTNISYIYKELLY